MQGFQHVDVPVLVHHGDVALANGDVALANGDKLRVRHIELAAIRGADYEWTEATGEVLANLVQVHTPLCPNLKVPSL